MSNEEWQQKRPPSEQTYQNLGKFISKNRINEKNQHIKNMIMGGINYFVKEDSNVSHYRLKP